MRAGGKTIDRLAGLRRRQTDAARSSALNADVRDRAAKNAHQAAEAALSEAESAVERSLREAIGRSREIDDPARRFALISEIVATARARRRNAASQLSDAAEERSQAATAVVEARRVLMRMQAKCDAVDRIADQILDETEHQNTQADEDEISDLTMNRRTRMDLQ